MQGCGSGCRSTLQLHSPLQLRLMGTVRMAALIAHLAPSSCPYQPLHSATNACLAVLASGHGGMNHFSVTLQNAGIIACKTRNAQRT